MKLRRLPLVLGSLGALVAGVMVPSTPALAAPHQWLDCTEAFNCAEVANPHDVWGSYYVGHDEPSTLFYSNRQGSGNSQRYTLTLPNDPPATNANASFNFELHPAFWFGMAMCDDQSYPESQWTYPGAGTTCTPNSDVNNVTYPNPSGSELAHHAGTAFMEMQFYPPGWALWPPGVSCSPTQWCAALNIDSLSEDPVTGQSLNKVCQSQVGVEYVNFAFITKNGVPVGPPNPVEATSATFDPTTATAQQNVLFMNSGDKISVTMHDTPSGFFVGLQDGTTGGSGTMVASAANGFGMVQFAPPPSNACNNIPYNFHPMYGTSSPQSRVVWAAHSYNVSFADEIGHFDYCSHVATDTHNCSGAEGSTNFGDVVETGDKDDTYCFNAPTGSGFVQVNGCVGTNTPGFDGVPYQNAWPTTTSQVGNLPAPILFTSPKTGPTYNQNYSTVAFETDLPRIEAADLGGSCVRTTGAGCTDPPPTDDGTPALFYPFFSAITGSGCQWAIGDITSGAGVNDFGGSASAEYGGLYKQWYLVYGGGGATQMRYNDFQNALSGNPCPA